MRLSKTNKNNPPPKEKNKKELIDLRYLLVRVEKLSSTEPSKNKVKCKPGSVEHACNPNTESERQKGQESKAIISYILSLRPASVP